MARTILSYFPKDKKLKCLEVNGQEILLDKEEFENSLISGHSYDIKLKKGIFTFSYKTYDKIKDRLWS
jgi:hypothetical protein